MVTLIAQRLFTRAKEREQSPPVEEKIRLRFPEDGAVHPVAEGKREC